MTKQTREPEYELAYCKLCGQMTNHYKDGRCAKCVKRDLDTWGSNNELWYVASNILLWIVVLAMIATIVIGGVVIYLA